MDGPTFSFQVCECVELTGGRCRVSIVSREGDVNNRTTAEAVEAIKLANLLVAQGARVLEFTAGHRGAWMNGNAS